jgi:hypothetical protein
VVNGMAINQGGRARRGPGQVVSRDPSRSLADRPVYLPTWVEARGAGHRDNLIRNRSARRHEPGDLTRGYARDDGPPG